MMDSSLFLFLCFLLVQKCREMEWAGRLRNQSKDSVRRIVQFGPALPPEPHLGNTGVLQIEFALCKTESWCWCVLRGRAGQQAAVEFDKVTEKGPWGKERV